MLLDGLFEKSGVVSSNQWFHLVINFIGPNAGEGFQIYHDGINVLNDTTKATNSNSRRYLPPNNGRIVTGRYRVDLDAWYASVQVDELLFYNRTLTEPEITILSNNTAWKMPTSLVYLR